MNFRERTIRDEEEVRRVLQDGHQATIWTGLPCVISSFNDKAITVECVPTVQGTITLKDGSQKNVNMPTLVDVPVVWPRGGGYTMTFPIMQGDECLVVFSSRCIDGWWQSGEISPPTDKRMHDLSDGFAFVGPFSQKTKIANISLITAQFRSDDGTVLVDLDAEGGIATVKAPFQIKLDAPQTIITGIIAVQNVGGIAVASTVNGTFAAQGDVLAGPSRTSLETHNHFSSGGTGIGGTPVPGS